MKNNYVGLPPLYYSYSDSSLKAFFSLKCALLMPKRICNHIQMMLNQMYLGNNSNGKEVLVTTLKQIFKLKES